MAIEWIAVAASAAVKAVSGTIVSGVAGQARKRIDKVLSKGPLEAPLRKAFTEAFTGFYKSLDAGLVFTLSNEEALARLPESDAFRDVVGQLPYLPFRQIAPEALRREFLAIGIEGADDATFGAAWQALGRRFDRAVAESEPLKSFVDLSSSARQEEREEKLLALVERLAEAQEKATQSADPEPAIRRYREAVLLEHQYADTRGLFMREKEGVGEEISLREVFVETPLARIVQEAPKDRREDGEEPELGRPHQERPVSKPETLPIRDLLSRERLVVILGPPGCGKSTLLRCLALTLCQSAEAPSILEHGLDPGTVPLLLPLKQYASGLRKESNLSLSDYFFDLFERDLPNLQEILASGHGLVLLDGLDEVFDEAHRGWVSEEVWRFTARFPRSHFVLTSRPRGYEAAPLPAPVPLWRLLPFDDQQIGRFFLGWFKALARVRGEAGAGETPETRAATLTKDVLSRGRLKEMAQNPLLCTLIVLVHRSRSGRLPERRAVFLDAAVRTLAEAWERLKRSPQQADLNFPEPEILIRALAEVAWRAFHPKPNREIAGNDLRPWLEEYLDREPDWNGGKGRRSVRDFLKLVGERTGLLVDLGGDRYQFVHLSLHEWLVSYFLLDRLNEGERVTVFRYYLHAPEWEEILRLLVGGAPRAQADLLATEILDRPTSSWESTLRRDLRFLFLCVGDQAPISPAVRERLVQESLAALRNPKYLDEFGFQKDLGRLGQAPTLMAEALAKLNDEDGSVRRSAVSYLTQVEAVDEETRQAVLAKLDDKDEFVRTEAVFYLARTAPVNDQTHRVFLAKLSDKDRDARRSALSYFMQVQAVDEETRRAVLAKLDDEDRAVRSSAVSYCARVGAIDEEVRRAVLAKLDDKDGAVRSSAVSYFEQVGVVDEETRRAVLTKLDDEDWAVRISAVFYFARVGAVDEEMHRTFRAKIDDKDGGARRLAVIYFEQAGMVDEETRRAVRAKLDDEDGLVRYSAVDYFAQVGAVDEEAHRAVLAKLDDNEGFVRSSAVSYFAQVGVVDEEVRRAVLAKLDDEEGFVRSSALQYFISTGFDERLLEQLWASFMQTTSYIPLEVVLLFAERMGTRMAEDKTLQDRVLNEARRRSYFYAPMLRALALQQNRLHRQANPLCLTNIPGCSSPA